MNIGTISYATQSGLGHLAKQFYDNGIINRILITNHPRYQSFPDWYAPTDRYDRSNFKRFIEGLHALIIFENAFNNWGIVQMAKRAGCKFILCPMYEWTPKPLPVKPDLVWCPSLLDVEYFKQYNHEFIHIPAPKLPWKERTIALEFVHNAGHGQVGYAKGTPEVLEAFSKYVKSPARLIVRGQRNEPRIQELFKKYTQTRNIQIVHDDISYEQLFDSGDVFINAERYNGLSLPLQEAHSSGMLVMTTDRFPANTWLPIESLIPVKRYERFKVNQSEFDRAEIDPQTIAAKVDEWYGRDISRFSQIGKEWAETNSWKSLKPVYLKSIEKIVNS